MAPVHAEKLYTIDDIYNLPDDVRAELIDGVIYYMAPPSRRHQEISVRLCHIILDYIDRKAGNCSVYAAPFAVFLNDDSKTYVEPDISIICDKNKLDDSGCHGAPDWVIEIVSPGSRKMDYYTKLFKYRSSGVREYWLVDPEKNRVLTWDFEHDGIGDYSFKDIVKVGIYENLYIDFNRFSD